MTTKGVSGRELAAFVEGRAELRGRTDVVVTAAKDLEAAGPGTIAWVSPKKADAAALVEACRAEVIVAPRAVAPSDALLSRALVVLADHPRLVFFQIVERFFAPSAGRAPGVHPTAIVDPEAKIAASAHVGPYCVVGKAVLGEGVVLEAFVTVHDGTTLGARVHVSSHTVLGVEGFGYTREKEGDDWLHVPHVGGVRVGDDVRIGSHACVVRGTLGDTVVGAGTKLDNFVTVGHNARVGARVLVASHSIVGGSATVGDDAWVSPAVTVLNGVHVGARVTLGVGAEITDDVPDGGKVVGAPGKLLPRAFWGKAPSA